MIGKKEIPQSDDNRTEEYNTKNGVSQNGD